METLCKALQLAPSANNGQNWEFIFVGDAEIKRRLVGACSNQSFVGNCTYFIAGVADPGQKWHMVDITIALTNFTLQAADLGYGTCWIGAFDENRVKEILGVPDEKKVVICMTFGRPEGRHIIMFCHTVVRLTLLACVVLFRFNREEWSWSRPWAYAIHRAVIAINGHHCSTWRNLPSSIIIEIHREICHNQSSLKSEYYQNHE